MKLIIERLDDQFFAYMEEDNQFKTNQKTRGNLVPHILLNEDCLLDTALDNGDHMVFNLVSHQRSFKHYPNKKRNK